MVGSNFYGRMFEPWKIESFKVSYLLSSVIVAHAIDASAVLNGRKVSGNDKCKFNSTHFGSSFYIQPTIYTFIDFKQYLVFGGSFVPWMHARERKTKKQKKKKQAKIALFRFFVNLTISVCLCVFVFSFESQSSLQWSVNCYGWAITLGYGIVEKGCSILQLMS